MTVYVSLPLSGPRAADGMDAADGARLALDEAGGAAGELEVGAKFLDDANGKQWDPVAVGRNARRAVQDSTTAAYIGELDSQPTRASLPITNDAGVVQISPGAGGVDLTRPAEGYPDSPDAYRPSGSPSLARVIPDDAALVSAAAEHAAALGATSIAVASDGSPYGELIASELAADAARVGIEFVAPGGEPEATLEPTQEGSLRLSGKGESEVAAALDPGELADPAFAASFEGAYGRAPGPYAAYGYEAMALALQAIEAADKDEEFRRSVLNATLDAERPDSILGRYSFTEDGDTTLCAIQPYTLDGDHRVPRKPICPPG